MTKQEQINTLKECAIAQFRGLCKTSSEFEYARDAEEINNRIDKISVIDTEAVLPMDKLESYPTKEVWQESARECARYSINLGYDNHGQPIIHPYAYIEAFANNSMWDFNRIYGNLYSDENEE